MALDAEALGEAINQRVEAARPAIVALYQSGDFIGGGRRCWTEIATAIIDHIKATAEVLPDGGSPMAAGGDPVTGTGRVA